MSDTERYKFKVTCPCGAILESARWSGESANIAVKEFNDSHKKCREPSIWQQVFGEESEVVLK